MLESAGEVLRSGVEARIVKEDVAPLVHGCLFWKVKSKNWYPRRFWLDLRCLCVRYEPSKKPFWSNPTTHGNLDIYVADVGPHRRRQFITSRYFCRNPYPAPHQKNNQIKKRRRKKNRLVAVAAALYRLS